jgi:steroid delta-isomerase-like uncharacterized protein
MADRDERILVERYIYDFWNEGDVDVADEIFAEHHLYDDVRLPGLARRPEGVRQRFGYYTRAIPGRIVDTAWVVQEGRTTCRWVGEGVHRGELGVYAPTGKPVVVSGVHVCSLRDGRIQRSWVMWDRLGTLAQIDEALACVAMAPGVPAGLDAT